MSETLILIDEEGVEHEFEVEAFLEVDDERYAVLIPISEEYEDEAVIMRFGKDENGEEVLFDIESDEEWERVADVYEGYSDGSDDGYDELDD
ncbi:MAG: DUF1292 domain-containing protein [Firmicutes bacterium]|nr:DUF1292 domain-containing protein [Bacillota bacterium]